MYTDAKLQAIKSWFYVCMYINAEMYVCMYVCCKKCILILLRERCGMYVCMYVCIYLCVLLAMGCFAAATSRRAVRWLRSHCETVEIPHIQVVWYRDMYVYMYVYVCIYSCFIFKYRAVCEYHPIAALLGVLEHSSLCSHSYVAYNLNVFGRNFWKEILSDRWSTMMKSESLGHFTHTFLHRIANIHTFVCMYVWSTVLTLGLSMHVDYSSLIMHVCMCVCTECENHPLATLLGVLEYSSLCSHSYVAYNLNVFGRYFWKEILPDRWSTMMKSESLGHFTHTFLHRIANIHTVFTLTCTVCM